MEGKLTIESNQSRVNPAVVKLSIAGILDANTAESFKQAIQGCLADQQYCLLLDFKNLDYISSAGIGAIVANLKSIRKMENGDVKICEVTSKIKPIIESIGLHLIVDVLEKEEECVNWQARKLVKPQPHFQLTLLTQRIVAGVKFSCRIEAYDGQNNLLLDYDNSAEINVTPGLIFPSETGVFQNGIWEGELTATDAGPIRLRVFDLDMENFFEINVFEDQCRKVFPNQIGCPSCQHIAKVKKAGIYRCPRCNEIFYVDSWIHAISIQKGSTNRSVRSHYKGFELIISSDVNYIDAIRQFIRSVSEQESLPETLANEVVLCIEEVVMNVIKHSYHFDPFQTLIIQIQFQDHQLAVSIRDTGEPYDVTQHKARSLTNAALKEQTGGMGVMMVQRLMDKITYRSYEKYNQLLMVKRYEPADSGESSATEK